MAMRRWTEAEDEYLRQNYKILPKEEIAEHLGRPITGVQHRAHRLEISSGRYFTESELSELDRNSKMSNVRLGQLFGRTPNSIAKARSLHGLPMTKEGGGNAICMAEVGQIVGRNKSHIYRNWIRDGLKWHQVGKYRMVKIKDLFRFMQEHPEKWDATECERWFFQQHNCDWFEKKRKEDFQKMIDRRWANGQKKKNKSRNIVCV